MDGFLIGILLFAVVLVVCLAYAFTFVTAGVFIIMPEGIFTMIVNFYDGSPVASVVAIVRVLVAIAFVCYLMKYLSDKDDDSVLRTSVILSAIASLLSSLFLILAVFKGGLDLALGMAQVELHVLLVLAVVVIWRWLVFPALVVIGIVDLAEKVSEWYIGNKFYQSEITIAVLLGVVLSSLFLAVNEMKVTFGQLDSGNVIHYEQQPDQSDMFQMDRGDQWCTIPLYDLSEREFLDFVPVDIIFKSCDIAEEQEVVATSSSWGVIYIRMPSNYRMEIGDIGCRNNSQYFPDDCSNGKYLWLQVGYISK